MRIRCLDLKDAFNIALIDYSELSFTFPFNPGANDLYSTFSLSMIPFLHVDQALWDFQVDILCSCDSYQELLLDVNEVKLIGKVWREEIWDACLVNQTLRESFYTVI